MKGVFSSFFAGFVWWSGDLFVILLPYNENDDETKRKYLVGAGADGAGDGV